MNTKRNAKQSIPATDHSGHRQRLRKRAAMEGIANFEPHNLLELLLFYTIPRADTNETGHRLLERFGSFAGVLEASEEDLMQVHGVGPESARFLHMLPEIFRIYMQEKSEPPKKIGNVREMTDMLAPLFVGLKTEMLYMVCIQAGNSVGRCVLLAEGRADAVELPVRRVVSEALLSECVGVVLAHNHPSGLAKASFDDYDATVRIANALNAIDVPLIDHLIFADGRFEALSNDSRFAPYFGTAYRTTQKKYTEQSAKMGKI